MTSRKPSQVESWGGTLSTFKSFWCQVKSWTQTQVTPRSIPPLSVLDWKLSNLLSLQYKKNKGKFAAFNGRLKAKSFSASGGFAPWPPEQGLCPWTPLGGRGLPQTPVIGSRSRARHKRPRLFDPPLCVTFRCPWLLIRVSATVTVYRGHRRTLLFHDRDLPVHRVHMNYYK